MSRPFEILVLAGNQRSGSHALSLAIERHSATVAPTEARFIPLFARVLWFAGSLDRRESRMRLLRAVFAFLYLWEKRNRTTAELRATVPFSILSVAVDAEKIADNATDFGAMVLTMYERFARRHGASTALEKITFFHYDPPERLSRVLPDVKIVHVVRDGRDVCLSWRRVWFGVQSVAEAAMRWRRYVSRLRAWGAAHPDRYLEVRYEDFLEDEVKTVHSVLRFAGIAASKDLNTLSRRKSGVLAGREGHEMLVRPVDKSNSEKWRTQMAAHDIVRFEAFAAEQLQAFGYPLTLTKRPAAIFRLAWMVHAIILYLVTIATWKRWALLWLPMALLITDRLHLGLTRRLYERAIETVEAVEAAEAKDHDVAAQA